LIYTLVSKVLVLWYIPPRWVVFTLKLGWPQRGGYTLSLGDTSREIPVFCELK